MSKNFNVTIDGKNWQAPSRKTETWRYSPAQDLLGDKALTSKDGMKQIPDDLRTTLDATLGDYDVIFGNDIKSAEQLSSDYYNVFTANTITPLDKNLGWAHLNQANNAEHLCINITQTPPKPLVLIYGLNGDAPTDCTHPNLRLDLAHNVNLSFVEIMIGGGISNALIEFDLEKEARLNHYVLEMLNQNAIHIGDVSASCEAGAHYHHLSLLQTGAMIRRDTKVMLENEQAHCTLNGIASLTGNSNLDNSTLIQHISPNTTSSEQFRAILDDESVHNFQGKIIVKQEAQQTEGYQMSRAMLLSDHARANHKPELEIYADEVKCSHGSTIGAPDNDQLFYLQTRGFSRQQALKFLCRAFLSELIGMVDDEKIQALFNHFAGYHGDE
ncbi:MAG: SufD family Fe-S cluster assembly protein [Alphaproteobacteria bacterium]|nr:SufD family Fe-S cluster assembly protein [Alphaproteobacteria bacterium]